MAYNKETGMYEGYIYKVVNTINGKIYIGQTRWNVSDRWSGHKHDAMRRNYNTVFAKAIRKYGSENFNVEIIEKLNENDLDSLNNKLNEKEIYYIKQFHSLSHENGYNITKGGNNTGEACKIKTYCYTSTGKLIGKFNSRADAGRYIGVSGEDVSAAIIRKGLCRGYYFSSSEIFDYIAPKHPLFEKQVKSYDYNGNIISHYNNCYDAASEIHELPENIYGSCNGTHCSAYGFIWRFEDDNFFTHKLPSKRTKCINQYDKNNNYIATFDSIKQAAEKLNLNESNIFAVLSKTNCAKTSGGFKWFCVNDPDQPDKTKIITS